MSDKIKKGFEFTGKYFKGVIRVLDVNEEKNELVVDLNNGGGWWVEEWMLDHTIFGFERGEYFTNPFPL